MSSDTRPRNPILDGVRLALYPAALILLANFPGRRALAENTGQLGGSSSHDVRMWQFLSGSMIADLALVLPAAALGITLFWLAVACKRRLFGRRQAGPAEGRGALVALFAALFAGSFLLSIGSSEHKLQRGLYPTLLEVRAGLADATFVKGSLPIFLLDRYLPASLLAVALFVALLFGLASRPARFQGSRRLFGFTLGWVGISGVSMVVLLMIHSCLPTVYPWMLTPPLIPLARDVLGADVDVDPRRVLAEVRSSDEDLEAGARALGFAPVQGSIAGDGPVKNASCENHPLARPLPGEEGIPDRPLVTALTALSRALVAGAGPISVWHIAIESFRADDIQAINPAAAPEVTPFVNSLYEAARRRDPHVLAFPRAYQTGIRTAQAISGLICGVGGMPMNLALARDLTRLPLRCLPDVLRDAGMRARVFYGSRISFDNMGEFFAFHGMELIDKSDLPAGLPRGVWRAVTDEPLYRHALAAASREPGAQYNFVLTLTNHIPFDRPADLPQEIEQRMMRFAAGRVPPIGVDALRRLTTMAYADWALRRFVEALDASPMGAQSLVLVSADHSTNDEFVWASGATPEAASRVPLFVILPRALVDREDRSGPVAKAAAEVNALAAETAVSLNDVPTLILSLLSRSSSLAALPPEQRWHTLGGAATSPSYALPEHATSLAWGINAQSHIFSVDEGAGGPVESKEISVSMNGRRSIGLLGAVGRPTAAFLGAFIRTFASHCWGSSSTRASAAVAEVPRH